MLRHRAYLKALNEWLKTRAGSSLNIHQLKSLIKIFKKMTKDFELQGVLNVREEPYGNIAVSHYHLNLNSFISSESSQSRRGNSFRDSGTAWRRSFYGRLRWRTKLVFPKTKKKPFRKLPKSRKINLYRPNESVQNSEDDLRILLGICWETLLTAS